MTHRKPSHSQQNDPTMVEPRRHRPRNGGGFIFFPFLFLMLFFFVFLPSGRFFPGNGVWSFVFYIFGFFFLMKILMVIFGGSSWKRRYYQSNSHYNYYHNQRYSADRTRQGQINNQNSGDIEYPAETSSTSDYKTDLPLESGNAYFCTNCGAKHDSDDKFCSKCGYSL